MELLLNLAWLLLALPAYWFWRGSRTGTRRFRPSHRLLALACMLVILFPVVSATDDLRAMRAEMEESPTSKRSCHVNSEKTFSGNTHFQSALVVDAKFSVAAEWNWYQLPVSSVFSTATNVLSSPERAPPYSPIA